MSQREGIDSFATESSGCENQAGSAHMSIGRDTLANLVGMVVPLATTLVTAPQYLRLIGVERYGTLAVIWLLLGYLGVFNLGLGRAASQLISRVAPGDGDASSRIFWTALLMALASGAVGSAALWGLADYLLGSVLSMSGGNRDEALEAIPWLVLILPLLLATSVVSGALESRHQFAYLSGANVVANTASQVVPLVVAWLGHAELPTLVVAAQVGRVGILMPLFLRCRTRLPLIGPPILARDQIMPLIRLGTGALIISILNPLLVSLDRVVIGTVLGTSEVAYYSVVYGLASQLLLVTGSLTQATFPRMAAADAAERSRLASHATRILLALITPLASLGALVVSPFLSIWLGADFALRASGIGELLLVGIWVNLFAQPHTQKLQAAGHYRKVISLYLMEIPFYIAALYFLLSAFGVIGAAAAWALRTAIDAPLQMLIANGLTKPRVYAISIISLSMIVISTISGSFLSPFSGWRPVIAVSVLVISVLLFREQASSALRLLSTSRTRAGSHLT